MSPRISAQGSSWPRVARRVLQTSRKTRRARPSPASLKWNSPSTPRVERARLRSGSVFATLPQSFVLFCDARTPCSIRTAAVWHHAYQSNGIFRAGAHLDKNPQKLHTAFANKNIRCHPVFIFGVQTETLRCKTNKNKKNQEDQIKRKRNRRNPDKNDSTSRVFFEKVSAYENTVRVGIEFYKNRTTKSSRMRICNYSRRPLFFSYWRSTRNSHKQYTNDPTTSC